VKTSGPPCERTGTFTDTRCRWPAGGGAIWLVSNLLAGMRFPHAGVWVVNTLTQGASFATEGLLIAMLRAALIRERALSRTTP
jgi:hypothetical protein